MHAHARTSITSAYVDEEAPVMAGSRPTPADTAREAVVEATVVLPRRAFEVWDEEVKAWACVKGSYEIAVGRSIADRRLAAPINV